MITDALQPQPESPKDQQAAASFTGFSQESTQPHIELKVKALNCPQCGAPILDNQPACSNCGTGLTYEFTFTGDTFNFKLPNGAREIPLATLPNLDLEQIAKKLVELAKQTSETVYLYWRKVPLVVSPDITAETALKERRLLAKQVERASLGQVWIEALKPYQLLVEKINSLNLQQKLDLLRLHREKRPGAYSWGDFQGFIERPDFAVMEDLMLAEIGENDAELLTNAVNYINGLMAELKFS